MVNPMAQGMRGSSVIPVRKGGLERQEVGGHILLYCFSKTMCP